MSGIRTIFLPRQTSGNEYQNLLGEALEKLGVEVDGLPGYRCSEAHLPSLLKPGGRDVLHFHWIHYFFATGRWRGAIRRSVRLVWWLSQIRSRGGGIVWTAHNLENHENRFRTLDRFCTRMVARQAHGIIAHTESAKNAVIERFGQKDKVCVIPHGHYIGAYPNDVSPAQAREALGIPKDAIAMLNLGLVRPYKGILGLVERFKELSHPDAQLIIAGGVNREDHGREVAARIGESSNIRFLPTFVPDDQIQVLMNASDVVVLPYRDILTSGSLILAMSFGKACIAPRIGCMSDTLDESGGFLYDPSDPNGLHDAMREAIRRKDELAEMGQHNIQVAEQWRWDDIARMTLDVYTQSV